MAALAPITLTDAESTPVDHVLNPISSGPVIAYHGSDSGVSTIGQIGLTLSHRSQVNQPDGINKTRLVLRVPVLEEVSGSSAGYVAPPAVAYYNMVTVECLCPVRGTSQDRDNLLTMLVDALGESQISETIVAETPPLG